MSEKVLSNEEYSPMYDEFADLMCAKCGTPMCGIKSPEVRKVCKSCGGKSKYEED